MIEMLGMVFVSIVFLCIIHYSECFIWYLSSKIKIKGHIKFITIICLVIPILEESVKIFMLELFGYVVLIAFVVISNAKDCIKYLNNVDPKELSIKNWASYQLQSLILSFVIALLFIDGEYLLGFGAHIAFNIILIIFSCADEVSKFHDDKDETN